MIIHRFEVNRLGWQRIGWLVFLEQDPPLGLVIGLIEPQGDRLIGRMVDGNSIFKFVGHRRASGV